MSKPKEVHELLDFAIKIAREAGDIALKYFRTDIEMIDKPEKDFYDPVTLADREIESCLRARIRQYYPGHTIIGEEEGVTPGDADFTWFIDPIDGTRGFVAGLPVWGILLGVMRDGQSIIGVMHQPFIKETYIGSNAGAFLLNSAGEKRLFCNSTDTIADAIMCNTHLAMFRSSNEMDIFRDLVDSCRFSRFGTDCYGYSQLAMGFVDFVLESSLELYDIIPLIPIVEAAGGVITDWDGNPIVTAGNVLASANAILHRELLTRIADIRS